MTKSKRLVSNIFRFSSYVATSFLKQYSKDTSMDLAEKAICLCFEKFQVKEFQKKNYFWEVLINKNSTYINKAVIRVKNKTGYVFSSEELQKAQQTIRIKLCYFYFTSKEYLLEQFRRENDVDHQRLSIVSYYLFFRLKLLFGKDTRSYYRKIYKERIENNFYLDFQICSVEEQQIIQSMKIAAKNRDKPPQPTQMVLFQIQDPQQESKNSFQQLLSLILAHPSELNSFQGLFDEKRKL